MHRSGTDRAGFVVDLFDAFSRHGQQIALRGEVEFTFEELLADVYRLARALDRLGLHRGEGLFAIIGNRSEALRVRLAAHLLGVRYAAAHPLWPAHLIETVLRDFEPAAVVSHPHHTPRPGRLPAAVGARYHLTLGPGEDTGKEVVDLLALAATESADPPGIRARDHDIAQILYTSGSTGALKGVINTFTTLAVEAAEWDRQPWPTPPDARFLAMGSLSHAGGGVSLAMLRRGVTVEPRPGFDADRFLADCRTGRPVLTYLYPHQIVQLLDAPRTAAGIPGLVCLMYGSDRLAPHAIAAAVARFGLILRQWYALMEVAPVSRLTVDDHHAAVTGRPHLLASVGRPVPEIELEVRDPAGGVLPAGQTGEICVRSPLVVPGYWRLDAPIAPDEWFPTGDLGHLDDDGYLYLTGRATDRASVECQNVYLAPIEDVLSEHPHVTQASVVAVPGQDTGDTVHAFLVPTSGTTLGHAELHTELAQFVHDRFGPLYVPTAFHVLAALPRNPVGKPDKPALRRLALQGNPGP
ncbi:AMP-binding protein [Streptomyces sp. NPDC056257]|uniref:AMP-binding protein n=1 Tax=Streptomyces sp. NPDC056257 TaxID=3345765 RepID=UPI0035D66421